MKKLLIITLILSAVFCFGCSSKNDDSSNMVKLNKVDISALSNQKIKNIIDDTSLEEGVYQIKTKSNNYIFFYGIKNKFTDIICSVEDNTLNICATYEKLDSSNEASPFKKLFVIYEKNTTISDDKTVYFDKIKLTIDGKDSNFKSVIDLN